MKYNETDFNNALKRKMDGTPAILLFGPDAGKVDEFADLAIEKLSIDSLNLFAIDADDLREKTDAMFADACTPSLLGGDRMIMIANAGDSDAALISELINHPSLSSFVIVTAGDLRAGGGLRKLFEEHAKCGILGCYADDDRALAALIQKELFGAGIKRINPDAMQYMCAHLGGDRGITRSFLKKLTLYVDDTKIVTLEDVEKCLPDSAEISIDDYLYSLTAGHIAQTVAALDRVFFDGGEPIMLTRMLDAHFKRLLNAVSGGVMPRLFWKVADKFNTAARIWPESEIVAVLSRLNELELQTKSSGLSNVSELLLRDFSLKLAMKSAKLAVKSKGK